MIACSHAPQDHDFKQSRNDSAKSMPLDQILDVKDGRLKRV